MAKDMPGRLLRLLSLLQTQRSWSGAELAARLGVTDRTVRRDVDRLRALDYPVQTTTGTAGGYRLTSGRNLPPLLLDDDEALAVAIALATAAAGGVAGVEESALAALTKLQQVLPARLRPRLTALTGTTAAVVPHGAPKADPEVLAIVAACCRDAEMLTFDYQDRAGAAAPRRVEPHRVVSNAGRWYLVAFDPERDDWRTFRLDRMADLRPTRRPFVPRELPAPDAASYLVRSFAGATYRHTARLAVGLSADAVRAGVFATIPGEIDEQDGDKHDGDKHGGDACTVRLTAESVELVVQFVAAIATLGAPVTVEEMSEEVAIAVRGLGALLAAVP
jgi:predicted DNA-binding transcriptional regulator YafY